MRLVLLFAAVYILIAAVACQPLREAKAELELSKRYNRKPPDRFKFARPASPKVKRRFQALASAADAVSEAVSRFRARVRGAKDAVQTTEENTHLVTPKAKPFARPIAKSESPDPSLKPLYKFEFQGNEAGYTGDIDQDMRKAKLYGRPPVMSGPNTDVASTSKADASLGTEVEGNKKEYKHMWQDPEQRPWMLAGAVVSALATYLLARNIKQDLETTQNLNAVSASSQDQQQAAVQQALDQNAALEASRSGNSARLRRRNSDLSANVATEHTQAPRQVHVFKRFNPFAAIRERVSRISMAEGYSNLVNLTMNLPSETKRLLVGYILGAVAMVTTGSTLIYFYCKGIAHHHSDPKPLPANYTVPETPPSPPSAPSDPVVHTLFKRSVLPRSGDSLDNSATPQQKTPLSPGITGTADPRFVREYPGATISLVVLVVGSLLACKGYESHKAHKQHREGTNVDLFGRPADRLLRRASLNGLEELRDGGLHIRFRDALATFVIIGLGVGGVTYAVTKIRKAHHHDNQKHKRDVSASSNHQQLRRGPFQGGNTLELMDNALSGVRSSHAKMDLPSPRHADPQTAEDPPMDNPLHIAIGALITAAIGVPAIVFSIREILHANHEQDAKHHKRDLSAHSTPHELRRRVMSDNMIMDMIRSSCGAAHKKGSLPTGAMEEAEEDRVDPHDRIIHALAAAALVKAANGGSFWLFHDKAHEQDGGTYKHGAQPRSPPPRRPGERIEKRMVQAERGVEMGNVDGTSLKPRKRMYEEPHYFRGSSRQALAGISIIALPLLGLTIWQAIENYKLSKEEPEAFGLPDGPYDKFLHKHMVQADPPVKASIGVDSPSASLQRRRATSGSLGRLGRNFDQVLFYAIGGLILYSVGNRIHAAIEDEVNEHDGQRYNRGVQPSPPYTRSTRVGERFSKRMVTSPREVEMSTMGAHHPDEAESALLSATHDSAAPDPARVHASGRAARSRAPAAHPHGTQAAVEANILRQIMNQVIADINHATHQMIVHKSQTSIIGIIIIALGISGYVVYEMIKHPDGKYDDEDGDVQNSHSKPPSPSHGLGNHLKKRMVPLDRAIEMGRMAEHDLPPTPQESSFIASRGRALMDKLAWKLSVAIAASVATGFAILGIGIRELWNYFHPHHDDDDDEPKSEPFSPPHKLVERASLQRPDLFPGSASSHEQLYKRAFLRGQTESTGETVAAEVSRVSSGVTPHNVAAPGPIEAASHIGPEAQDRIKAVVQQVGEHLGKYAPIYAGVSLGLATFGGALALTACMSKHLQDHHKRDLVKRGFLPLEGEAIVDGTRSITQASSERLKLARQRLGEHLQFHGTEYYAYLVALILAGVGITLVVGSVKLAKEEERENTLHKRSVSTFQAEAIVEDASHITQVEPDRQEAKARQDPGLAKYGLSMSEVRMNPEKSRAIAAAGGRRVRSAGRRVNEHLDDNADICSVLILALLVAGAGGGIWFYNHKLGQKDKEKHNLSKRSLSPPEPEAIVEETKALAQEGEQQSKAAAQRLGRFIVRYKQGEIFALTAVAIAASVTYLGLLVNSLIKEADESERQEEPAHVQQVEQAHRSNALSKRAPSLAVFRNASEDAILAEIKRQELEREHLELRKYLQEREKAEHGADSPHRLSKRGTALTQLSGLLERTGADLKSLVHKTPLTAEERQARNGRLLKLGVIVGTAAAFEVFKTYIMYEAIKWHVQDKDRQRFQDEWRRQQQVQQQQLSESGLGSPRSLSKRALPLPKLLDALRVAKADFRSLASGQRLPRAARLARNRRMRKYAAVGGAVTVLQVIQFYLLYRLLKHPHNNRDRQRSQDAWNQQQQHQTVEGASNPKGRTESSGTAPGRTTSGSLSSPSGELQKRAGISPVSASQLAQAVEHPPPFYQLRRLGNNLREWGSDVGEKVVDHIRPITWTLGVLTVMTALYESIEIVAHKHPEWFEGHQPALNPNENLRKRELYGDELPIAEASSRPSVAFRKRSELEPLAKAVSETVQKGESKLQRAKRLNAEASATAAAAAIVVGGLVLAVGLPGFLAVATIGSLYGGNTDQAHGANSLHKRADVLPVSERMMVRVRELAAKHREWRQAKLKKHEVDILIAKRLGVLALIAPYVVGIYLLALSGGNGSRGPMSKPYQQLRKRQLSDDELVGSDTWHGQLSPLRKRAGAGEVAVGATREVAQQACGIIVWGRPAEEARATTRVETGEAARYQEDKNSQLKAAAVIAALVAVLYSATIACTLKKCIRIKPRPSRDKALHPNETLHKRQLELMVSNTRRLHKRYNIRAVPKLEEESRREAQEWATLVMRQQATAGTQEDHRVSTWVQELREPERTWKDDVAFAASFAVLLAAMATPGAIASYVGYKVSREKEKEAAKHHGSIPNENLHKRDLEPLASTALTEQSVPLQKRNALKPVMVDKALEATRKARTDWPEKLRELRFKLVVNAMIAASVTALMAVVFLPVEIEAFKRRKELKKEIDDRIRVLRQNGPFKHELDRHEASSRQSTPLRKRSNVAPVAETATEVATEASEQALAAAQRAKARLRENAVFYAKMTGLGTAIVALMLSPWELEGIGKLVDAQRLKQEEAKEKQELHRRALVRDEQAPKLGKRLEIVLSGAVMMRVLNQVALGSHRSEIFGLFGDGSERLARPRHRLQRRPRPVAASASPNDLARIAREVTRSRVRAAEREQAAPMLKKRMVQLHGLVEPSGTVMLRVFRQVVLGSHRSSIFDMSDDDADTESSLPAPQLPTYTRPPRSTTSASPADLVRIAEEVTRARNRAAEHEVRRDGDDQTQPVLKKRVVQPAGLVEPTGTVTLRVFRQLAIGAHRSDIFALFDDDDSDAEYVPLPSSRLPVYRRPLRPVDSSASPADLARIARERRELRKRMVQSSGLVEPTGTVTLRVIRQIAIGSHHDLVRIALEVTPARAREVEQDDEHRGVQMEKRASTSNAAGIAVLGLGVMYVLYRLKSETVPERDVLPHPHRFLYGMPLPHRQRHDGY
ncbi:hypothetical protein [Sporisorium scitamineum]|uniref:Transmembrane protein n=1 Tax=Sporisorium scitamineum TaxID=49012 RepID=A0A0F7S849_9BASI|nr:hypothetical protein [Sporisorium scitamineum]